MDLESERRRIFLKNYRVFCEIGTKTKVSCIKMEERRKETKRAKRDPCFGQSHARKCGAIVLPIAHIP